MAAIRRIMIITAVLAALVPTFNWSAHAQATVDLYLKPIDSSTGQPVYDACFVLENYSNQGCDENRDGQIKFAAIPVGEYTIVQTQPVAGLVTISPMTINITGNSASQTVTIELDPVGTNTGSVTERKARLPPGH